MLFRQMFERESSTYSYLLAARPGAEALLIDPIKEELPKYLQLIRELDLRLVFALDTHVHADHVTALGDLRAVSDCVTYSLLGGLAQTRAGWPLTPGAPASRATLQRVAASSASIIARVNVVFGARSNIA